MKLIVDENDLARMIRRRTPRVSDFKPEVQAAIGQVAEVWFSYLPGTHPAGAVRLKTKEAKA